MGWPLLAWTVWAWVTWRASWGVATLLVLTAPPLLCMLARPEQAPLWLMLLWALLLARLVKDHPRALPDGLKARWVALWARKPR